MLQVSFIKLCKRTRCIRMTDRFHSRCCYTASLILEPEFWISLAFGFPLHYIKSIYTIKEWKRNRKPPIVSCITLFHSSTHVLSTEANSNFVLQKSTNPRITILQMISKRKGDDFGIHNYMYISFVRLSTRFTTHHKLIFLHQGNSVIKFLHASNNNNQCTFLIFINVIAIVLVGVRVTNAASSSSFSFLLHIYWSNRASICQQLHLQGTSSHNILSSGTNFRGQASSRKFNPRKFVHTKN